MDEKNEMFIELSEEEILNITGGEPFFEKAGKFLHNMFCTEHGVITTTWSQNITKIDTSISAMKILNEGENPSFNDFIMSISQIVYFLRYGKVNELEITLSTFLKYCLFAFLISAIILWYPTRILSYFGLMPPVREVLTEIEEWFWLLSAVVLSPIIEELLFRLPLNLFKAKSYFNLVVFGFSLGFAVIHASNYQLEYQH